LKLIEKRARYGELVKEMFAPSIDRFKQKELELRKEKLKHPVRPRIRSGGRQRADDIDNDPGFNSETEAKRLRFKPRKFKDNPMIPKP